MLMALMLMQQKLLLQLLLLLLLPQDTLKALNLQDVPPWELAGGAAAAVLLTYTLYRNRRRVRRAAADFAAGVAQTAQMAVGMSVNPMAAVPGTSHMR
jgi:uncharacterized membrane protein YdcZ (DUF606 family)